jgi:hypothetical protein
MCPVQTVTHVSGRSGVPSGDTGIVVGVPLPLASPLSSSGCADVRNAENKQHDWQQCRVSKNLRREKEKLNDPQHYKNSDNKYRSSSDNGLRLHHDLR